jgi:hypothetical protein
MPAEKEPPLVLSAKGRCQRGSHCKSDPFGRMPRGDRRQRLSLLQWPGGNFIDADGEPVDIEVYVKEHGELPWMCPTDLRYYYSKLLENTDRPGVLDNLFSDDEGVESEDEEEVNVEANSKCVSLISWSTNFTHSVSTGASGSPRLFSSPRRTPTKIKVMRMKGVTSMSRPIQSVYFFY